jgi:hypothetical protein
VDVGGVADSVRMSDEEWDNLPAPFIDREDQVADVIYNGLVRPRIRKLKYRPTHLVFPGASGNGKTRFGRELFYRAVSESRFKDAVLRLAMRPELQAEAAAEASGQEQTLVEASQSSEVAEVIDTALSHLKQSLKAGLIIHLSFYRIDVFMKAALKRLKKHQLQYHEAEKGTGHLFLLLGCTPPPHSNVICCCLYVSSTGPLPAGLPS